MRKGWMFLTICAVLLIMILGGCASKPASTDSKPSATDGKPAADPQQAAIDFPKSTVTIIVPYTAGGGTDLNARALASYLSDQWGVSVIVNNQVGGSGAIGMSALVRAKPDGYTVILTALGAATLTPLLNDVGYTNKEFAPIAQVTEMTNVLAVHSNSGIKTLEELFEQASVNPQKLTFGTTGAVSPQALLTEQLERDMNMPNVLTHVPFDGGAQAISALVGEQTDAVTALLPDMLGHIQSGTITPLVVFTNDRVEELPDVPSVGELGYPDVAVPNWFGFAAPAGTPEEILDFWDTELKNALSDAEVKKLFENMNQKIVYLNRDEFTQRWMETYDLNAKILEEGNQLFNEK